jgi:Na+/H+ antiporter NhaD/arsenite permease-like protein
VNLPIIVLALVFILVAVRQVGSIRLHIWQAMLFGALIVLATGHIEPMAAWRAINLDVMLFLFAMFIVGQGLEESGYLAHVSYKYFRQARSRDALLMMIIFAGGIASAFLMNDTLAIIGTPVALLLARKHAMSPKLLLLALAFAVTVGSVMSPIGNPQNPLIALSGEIGDPFLTFIRYLLLPTILNLCLTFLLLKRSFPDDFHDVELKHSQEPIRNHELAVLSRLSLRIVVLLVAAKILTSPLGLSLEFRLTHIALAACLPILVGSSRRWLILRRLDWHTLIFFAAMFVLMESVWETGFFQSFITATAVNLAGMETILCISILLSQLISNVPLVALYQPLLLHTGVGTAELMALAAGSTIAGNMFILGAASNVIIIQNAERRSRHTITFVEFARVGVPLTFANTIVFWLCLKFL